MKIRIKIQGALVFLVAAAALFLPKLLFHRWHSEPGDEILDMAGTVIVLFGFLFRISSRGYKEENTLNGNVLVKDGPYRMVRNPMYLGTLMIGTGIVMVLFEWWTFLVFALAFMFIYVPQINREEKILLKRFGSEYAAYRAVTPKYFPHPVHLFNIKRYLALKFSWIRKELAAFMATIIVIILIEAWEDMGNFGPGEFFEEVVELISICSAFMALVFLFRKKTPASGPGA